ncbi:restriction endonuclease subunit S [Cyanobium sp. HWJ4-Hawea]|uniref:restriction endonuclease subunit S n=1 Tax=Cyanobium sp. HWJ4-Hawea TaxID=2823713 RepID=UPI0020CC90E5|nr:restriction endonuclease subunit S [Cyanobium sp. HWJ4-Hawea]MCP9808840.1 restriction endonuclease subunit S [Cyanobium sp. HWJ4-Hawea]
MDVKPGYKQTEVGVIPEEWNIEPLGKLTQFVTSGSRGWAQFYSETGALFIRSQNVRDGRLTFDDIQFVSPPSGAEGNRTKVELNDLLITITGNSVGNVALVEQQFDEAYISQHVGLVRLNKPSIGPYACRYLSPCSPGNPQISGSQSGQSKPGLNLQNLRDFLIALPRTLDESNAIATALSDVDGLLDGLDRLIAKKRDLKQAAMQQLLTGQTRLPGFSGEWAVKRLGEIAHIKTGSRNNENKVEDGKYPFFVRSDNVERINSYSHNCEAILIPGEGRIGDIFHYINGRFDVHQRVYAITQFAPAVSGKFVHLYMAMNFGAWAMQNTVKATVDSLRLPTFQNFEMCMPTTLREQTAIAKVLTEVDAELTALVQQREKTRALKQGMMQELLTGRTRLV